MSEHDDTAYLLRCFEGDVTRRAVLGSLAALVPAARAAHLPPIRAMREKGGGA